MVEAAGDSKESSLFRIESLRSNLDTGFGEPLTGAPASWALLSLFFTALVLSFFAIAILSEYSRKEVVRGIVRSTGEEIRVFAHTSGRIASISVEDGQIVGENQRLLTIDTDHGDMEGRKIEELAAMSLDREIQNLDSRIAATSKTADIDHQGMIARLSSLENEHQVALTSRDSASRRLDFARTNMMSLEPLAKRGYITQETMRRRQDELMVLGQAVTDAAGNIARIDGQLADLRAAVARHPSVTAQQKSELVAQGMRLRRDRDATAALGSFAINAPVAGTITALQVSRGQHIDAQRTLLTIARSRAAVTAELFVPSRAIGFVKSGQRVGLFYDAFPYHRFGMRYGRISAISASVLRPNDIEAAVQVEEPVYRVIVSLDDSEINAYGSRYPIRSGMALTATVTVGRQSVISWLLDPLYAVRGSL